MQRRFTLRRVILFLAAAGTAASAASPSSPASVFGDVGSYPGSSWVLADFDGDSQIDVVTSRARPLQGHEYAHEVSLSLSGSPSTSFTFRDRYASVELNSLDVDGDRDRDIIVREAASSELLAVWLNDGSGHFLPGDVERFRAVLETHRGAGIGLPRIDGDPVPEVSDQRNDPASVETADPASPRQFETLASETTARGAGACRCGRHTRAPPRSTPTV